jgi:ribonuclease/clavin/mitogillin
MNMINVGYDSSNYYLLEPDTTGLLIDIGWPGTLPKLQNVLKRKGIAFQKVRYLLVTHYHPDHGGLAQEMKNQGVRLIVIDSQPAWIPVMARYMKPEQHYQEISLYGNIDLSADASHKFLAGIGIRGEIISTPGHSEDSVSLILDEGMAFTGDLTNLMVVTEEARRQVEESWAKIRAHHVRTIYPGHGPVYAFA